MSDAILKGNTAAAESGHGLRKVLTWKDGLAIAMVMPAGAVASYGYWQGALGTWGTMLIIGISTLIAILQAVIVAELAGMFPDKPGGIGMFAHEGWKRYTNLAGPLAAFGYWFGWSVALALNGLVIGQLLQAQFFPDQTWGGTVVLGPLSFTWGLAHLIGAAAIIVVWLFNVMGAKVLAVSSYFLGAMLMIPLAIFMFGPFLTGQWSSANLSYHVMPDGSNGHDWTYFIVWLYLMGWSTYGIEIVATFVPEFKNPQSDTPRALRWCSIITAATFFMMPLATGGMMTDGKPAGGGAAGAFYTDIAAKLLGGGAPFIILLLCAALLLVMNGATADGGRVLYGMSRDGLTLKSLGKLNHHAVPARAMTVDLFVNLFLLFFVSNPVGIYATANLGYFVTMFFMITAFILLRKDRPNWPRPIKLSSIWVPIAWVLAFVTVILTVIGATRYDLSGYGSLSQLVIGILVLLLAIVLWIYRQTVEDGKAIAWRDTSPVTTPKR
jgi:amino acid transporter